MNIKELRRATGMTQKAFSEWLKIPKRTVEAWEMGDRVPPAYVVELIAFRIEHDGTLCNQQDKQADKAVVVEVDA